LRARRRRARFRLFILLGTLALVLACSLIWLVRQPYLRVSSVEVYGADQSLAAYATSAMQGSWLGILPKNSTLLIPEQGIRAAISKDHPDYAAVSIFRDGFSAITIKVIDRVAIARWCGLAPPSAGEVPYCYLFDASGYIYAADQTSELGLASSSAANAPALLNDFAVYGALAASSTEPIGSTLASTDQLPDAFAFARKVTLLGSPVESVVVRTDAGEVDDLLASGTRITYVLGQEIAAYAALDSAIKDLNLEDGSISYIDLRFPGNIYVKKVGE
jgi:cell division septal protein FtsQ